MKQDLKIWKKIQISVYSSIKTHCFDAVLFLESCKETNNKKVFLVMNGNKEVTINFNMLII